MGLEDQKIALSKHDVPTQSGVGKVEAADAVWSPYTKAILWFGVAAISYVYSLDGTTTYQYIAYATSSFQLHSALASIAVAQAITLALSKPISAKIGDVLGRAEAFCIAVIFYVVGFIIIATSNGIASYGAGACIYYIGYASVQILVQIVVADLTTLKWRTLVSACCSAPFFINAFVSANIAQGVLDSSSWRWGYAMFCFIIPAGALPIILTLLWAQWKARKLGLLATNYHNNPTFEKEYRDDRNLLQKIRYHAEEIDLLGLLLIGFGVALILIPLTVVNNGTTTWQSGSVIAMFVCGFVIFALAIVYEGWFARVPIIPRRFVTNRTVMAACVINGFDFISFYLQFAYQYSFIYIVKDWSIKNQGYFAYTQTIALTVFAIFSGLYILAFHRAKKLLIIGLVIRLLGVGLMIHSKGANGGTAELVIVQIIQGAGGGIAAACTQTAAQATVPHQDLAGVTAVVLLAAEIGGAIGTAIAGAIWRNTMPEALASRLLGIEGVNQTVVDSIYGSITTAATYPIDSPIRQATISAYTHVMTLILIPSTVLALIPIIASFFVKDVYFGDEQNVVETEELDIKIARSGSDIDVKA